MKLFYGTDNEIIALLPLTLLICITMKSNVCKAISGYFVVLARNCLASTLDYIVMQMRKLKVTMYVASESLNCVPFITSLNGIDGEWKLLTGGERWSLR